MTHPITPPPELLKQWEDDWFDERENVDVLLLQAFQAGADQELEACCELMDRDFMAGPSDLRAARRHKPPSLKKQALALIDDCADPEGDYLDDNALSIIRRALEQLND